MIKAQRLGDKGGNNGKRKSQKFKDKRERNMKENLRDWETK